MLERIEEEAEFVLGVFFGEPEELEDFALDFLIVDTDAAAGDFGAVEHEVVSFAEDGGRIGLKAIKMILDWCGEGMVEGVPSLGVFAPVDEWKIDDPEEVPCLTVGGEEIQIACELLRSSPRALLAAV